MRIRKNVAKLSPLLCVQGGSVPVETHVCQLNQSPWDVISFDSDSIQFQLDHAFTPNGDSYDSCCRNDHHLSFSLQPTPYNDKSHSQVQVQPVGAAGGSRRAKTRGPGKKPPTGATSSNPYEFYYYSGFGPLWGKRRGDRNGGGGEGTKNGIVVDSDNNDNVTVAQPLSDDDEEIIDYVNDDDDEEEEAEDDSGKKRMRKPVKARSLKSLIGERNKENSG